MTSLYLKTAKYSILTIAVLMLFTAVPSFAAKKDKPAKQLTILQQVVAAISVQAAIAAPVAQAIENTATSTEPAPTAPIGTPAPEPAVAATGTAPVFTPTPIPVQTDPSVTATTTPAQTEPQDETPVPEEKPEAASPVANAFTAVGKAVNSVKNKIFAKPADKVATTTASSTGAIATTGIATLFAGPALSGNVYDSNQFNESETYKLLALALALAAAGLFLTNTEVFSRTYGGIGRVITITNPQTSRSRA